MTNTNLETTHTTTHESNALNALAELKDAAIPETHREHIHSLITYYVKTNTEASPNEKDCLTFSCNAIGRFLGKIH